jgi:ubiquinone/menaquinone biosynthesis C-methylase UbiE
MPPMQISSPAPAPVAREADVLAAWIPGGPARLLELGCGRAELTRAIAVRHPEASVTALEVDRAQHAINLAIADLPTVTFGFGGADAIPLPDASFDVVLMAKSLHHVPVDRMDAALAEIRRVLRPGGVACFSEPVYEGEFNALMSIFHDEKQVREAAFAALCRAVDGGGFELAAERFWTAIRRYRDFDDFAARMIGVTHTDHHLTEQQWRAVRERFARSLTASGAQFEQSIRTDVLRRR